MTILKEYRINNNLGQQEMAKKLECSLPAYRNYEIGKRIIPHNVLINFLKIRGRKQDLELVTALEKIYENDISAR